MSKTNKQRRHMNGAPTRWNKTDMVLVFMMTELLSDQSRAAKLREVVNLAGGRRSRRTGQPTAGGAWPRQAVVAEGDQDGTSISDRRYWSSELMVSIMQYHPKTPKLR